MEFWNDDGFAETLSERDKVIRNVFVDHYLKDYDAVAACIRVGFTEPYARQWSAKYMAEPYVLQRISDMKLKTPEDEKDQEELDKQLTLSVLREAAQNGPFASRVAAASKLAAILGLDKPIQTSLEITGRGGVMMVPGIGDIKNWEDEAVKMQADLIKDAQE
jgi:hypothetical protein